MSAARRLALDALRRDPIQPAALRVLGQVVSAGGGSAAEQKALPLVLASQRLSRRELLTQLWLIDYYARRGDPEAMVRQFDLALRSSESARGTIFPLLDAAAFDPAVREALLDALAKRPNWAEPLATFAAHYGTNLDFSLELARMLLDPRTKEDRFKYLGLIHRLVEAGRFQRAWQVYNDPSLGLGPEGVGTIRNGTFEAPEDASPFDWSFVQEPELWASREQLANNRSVLRVAAYNGRSGDVAWQLLHLAPGNYEASALVGGVLTASVERPRLRIECAGGGAVLLSLRSDAGGAQPRTMRGRLAVPSNCAFQRVSISASGDGAPKETSPWVDDVRIRRIR